MEVHTLDSPPPTYVGSAASPLTDFWECREMHQPAGKVSWLFLKCYIGESESHSATESA